MPTFRVTQGMMTSRTLLNLGQHQREIMRLQEQLATGQKVNAPSDNPLAARRAVDVQMEIDKNKQFMENISAAGPFLTETETAMMTSIDVIQRAKELGLQGITGTNGALQRNQISNEIDQLLENMVTQGNHITNGRYIFGGTRTLQAPYEATRDAQGDIASVAFNGNSSAIEVEISEGIKTPINTPGQAIFNPAAGADLFDTLIQMRDALRADNVPGIEAQIDQLDQAMDQMQVGLSRLGAIQARFERVEENLETINVQLQEVRSDNVDADMAEVIVNLNTQSNAFEASLNAAARVIQPSLLQFIR